MADSQTGLALAIRFNLVPEEKLHVVAKSLDKLEAGLPQLAYRMLLEKGCPSWTYPVSMGATTIWERWDSMLPDESLYPGQMSPFNHYALRSIVDWLHGVVGGISPLEAGWKKVKVQPVPGDNLTIAKVSFEGPYGMVARSWHLQCDRLHVLVTVPPDTIAGITLPNGTKSTTVGSGTHDFDCAFEAVEWPP